MVAFDEIELQICDPKYGIDNSELLKNTLRGNVLVDDVLHVVTYVSNVAGFRRRWELMRQFIDRMNCVERVKLYVVELAYGVQDFAITEAGNHNICSYALNTHFGIKKI